MLPPQANSAPSHPALPVALQELEVGGGAGYAGRISTYSLGSTMVVGGGGKEGPDLSCERTEEGRDQTNPPAPSERRRKNPRTQVSEE